MKGENRAQAQGCQTHKSPLSKTVYLDEIFCVTKSCCEAQIERPMGTSIMGYAHGRLTPVHESYDDQGQSSIVR